MGEPRRVQSPLEPVVDAQSRVLILGTMPSPLSRERGYHYANPQNRFWRILAALWDEDLPADVPARRDFCARHRIARARRRAHRAGLLHRCHLAPPLRALP